MAVNVRALSDVWPVEILIQKAQQEIARQLLKSGVDSSIIATATHLSVDQIKSLR